MLRYLLAVAMTALGTVGLLAACGTGTPSSAPTGPKVVDITVSGGPAKPAEPVDVRRGQAVELEIHADDSGTIRIESAPEQTIEYHAGTTQASVGPFSAVGPIAIKRVRPVATIVTLRVR